MILFLYIDSNVLPFALRMEYGERHSQSHSGEYGWLGPYPTWNTQGRLYPYIPGSFNYSDPYGLALLGMGIYQWPIPKKLDHMGQSN